MDGADPGSGGDEVADHLVWHSTMVGGRRTNYGVAGEGLPVLFLHGWALGHHAYKRALKRLIKQGCRVFAPAMPGFGGSADLPREGFGVDAYARWAAGFLDAVGVDEPVFAVGHSFGGAVAVQLAHDHPDRVGYLVLVNSVGGATWLKAGSKVRSMSERPLWDWGLHFPGDLLPLRGVGGMLQAMLEDALPNMLCNPLALWRAGQLARRADLTAELLDLKVRRIPVVVLWGDKDTVIPRASFEALCAAIGSTGEVVPGRHSWLLADPDAFGEVMRNSLSVARSAREMEAAFPPLAAVAGEVGAVPAADVPAQARREGISRMSGPDRRQAGAARRSARRRAGG
ncbi:alpha/beta hydrolase [Acidiferrimicrobium sp. IK]|uniref:alpha/beta fold hydrolase n=1 Tax=Acidiferrimicrobium sp. IK TaxID=2871700 RepID=UPI0029168024|nr:alpha/beta hydrolase [Acidiferrimicrobium sp. IK]MCU4186225.1 alpha/beta hydrolase [Acidiferrimicrobium sp. IK]